MACSRRSRACGSDSGNRTGADGAEGRELRVPMKTADCNAAPRSIPVVLKGLASLRRLTGTYPSGHPSIVQKTTEILDALGRHLRESPEVRTDVIHGQVFLDGCRSAATPAPRRRSSTSWSISASTASTSATAFRPKSCSPVAECLWRQERTIGEVARRSWRHEASARSASDVWCRSTPGGGRSRWPDAPTGPLDPSYAESLVRTQETLSRTSPTARSSIR